MKARMAFLWRVASVSGAHEKRMQKNLEYPYQEPTQVSLGEKPKVCRCNVVQGIRHIGPVPSE